MRRACRKAQATAFRICAAMRDMAGGRAGSGGSLRESSDRTACYAPGGTQLLSAPAAYLARASSSSAPEACSSISFIVCVSIRSSIVRMNASNSMPGGIGSMNSIAPVVPGFSYAITDAAGAVRAVLSTLASQSQLNIISSPSLMVLNNQTATINVGDEVPVTTQQQQSTAAESTIVNSIEFRDTGVLLTVTPRVNPGGLVIMEI